jgi:hypothetical protein
MTPSGLEHDFEEMAALFAAAAGGLPDPERAGTTAAKYGLRLDLGSIRQLMQAHGLRGQGLSDES